MSDTIAVEQSSLSTPAFAISNVAAAVPPRARLVVVDDDDLVRDTLERNLTDADFGVRTFESGPAALKYLLTATDVDIVLLDWKMPGMVGIDVLHQMREAGLMVPVLFLTGLADQTCEEVALRDGAVDFVEKGRGLSILVHRINLILEGVKASASAEGSPTVQFGELTLKRDVFHALWKRQEVPLTLTEFRIIDLLAAQPGQHIAYRALYDIVHGKDFVAGSGPEGYRANVRTFIKRIRKKFRDLDGNWDLIENYAGFGYRWRSRESAAL
jgi:two-component system, OmpR family, response regulator ChvI